MARRTGHGHPSAGVAGANALTGRRTQKGRRFPRESGGLLRLFNAVWPAHPARRAWRLLSSRPSPRASARLHNISREWAGWAMKWAAPQAAAVAAPAAVPARAPLRRWPAPWAARAGHAECGAGPAVPQAPVLRLAHRHPARWPARNAPTVPWRFAVGHFAAAAPGCPPGLLPGVAPQKRHRLRARRPQPLGRPALPAAALRHGAPLRPAAVLLPWHR